MQISGLLPRFNTEQPEVSKIVYRLINNGSFVLCAWKREKKKKQHKVNN